MNFAAIVAESYLFEFHTSPVLVIVTWGFYAVLFSGLVCAIFSAFKKTPNSSPDSIPSGPAPATPVATPPSSLETNPTIEERLRTLVQLKEAGLITADDCEARKQKILEAV